MDCPGHTTIVCDPQADAAVPELSAIPSPAAHAAITSLRMPPPHVAKYPPCAGKCPPRWASHPNDVQTLSTRAVILKVRQDATSKSNGKSSPGRCGLFLDFQMPMIIRTRSKSEELPSIADISAEWGGRPWHCRAWAGASDGSPSWRDRDRDRGLSCSDGGSWPFGPHGGRSWGRPVSAGAGVCPRGPA